MNILIIANCEETDVRTLCEAGWTVYQLSIRSLGAKQYIHDMRNINRERIIDYSCAPAVIDDNNKTLEDVLISDLQSATNATIHVIEEGTKHLRMLLEKEHIGFIEQASVY